MKAKYYIYLFVVLILLYAGLSLLPAPDANSLSQYHLSASQARLLSATIVLPVIGIWLVAMYGFVKLKDYALIIRNSKDGHALNKISTGLLFLALGSPLASVVSTYFKLLVRTHPYWLSSTTIINNYVALLTMVIGIYFIAAGAEKLAQLVRKKPSDKEQRNLVLLFILLSSFYSYFIITQPIHNTLEQRIYYMPNVMVILTVAIPYLYFWYRGLVASYYLYHYQKKIKGEIYKGSLSLVAYGIAIVIMSSVLVRLLITISARISTLSLTPLLLFIYGLLVVAAVGYVLIALGAKKLRRIEEV